MGSQVMFCLSSRKENPARSQPSTVSWHPCSNRTECKGSLFSHSLQSTEALRYICMFSHCCINYGWNTDGVSSINAWSTLSLMLLAISKNLWHFYCLGRGESVYICVQTGSGGAEYVINPQNGILLLTHTVDLKQPWTNGSSGLFFFMFFIFMVLTETQWTVT